MAADGADEEPALGMISRGAGKERKGHAAPDFGEVKLGRRAFAREKVDDVRIGDRLSKARPLGSDERLGGKRRIGAVRLVPVGAGAKKHGLAHQHFERGCYGADPDGTGRFQRKTLPERGVNGFRGEAEGRYRRTFVDEDRIDGQASGKRTGGEKEFEFGLSRTVSFRRMMGVEKFVALGLKDGKRGTMRENLRKKGGSERFDVALKHRRESAKRGILLQKRRECGLFRLDAEHPVE